MEKHFLNIPGVEFSCYLTDEDSTSEYEFTTECYQAVIKNKPVTIYVDIFSDSSAMLQILDDNNDEIAPEYPYSNASEIQAVLEKMNKGE